MTEKRKTKIKRYGLVAHADFLKARQEQSTVQRFREHVALVLCARAVRNGAVQLWLCISLSGENVFFHFWEEGLMQRANASPLDTGKMPQIRGISVSHGGYAL